MGIPATHKQWFNYLREVVGGDVSVHAYYDEGKKNSIDIFSSVNDERMVTATVGLMEIDQSKNKNVTVFTELLMDLRGRDDKVCNILSTIAFYIKKDGWRVAPGVVFEQMVEMYFPRHPLPHVMFVPPFQWETEMTKVQLPDKLIHPLVAVPISEAERKFAAANKDRALERLWESKSIDVPDWSRESAA
jgi:suppressor of fused protein SUFU